jgi:four helix bundle protein
MNQPPTGKHEFDLEKRTLTFAKEVIKLCKQLPQRVITREIVGQLIRSSGSVGANYREANDALSKKDFSHRMKITRKEAKETCY